MEMILARLATGFSAIEAARQQLREAHTLEELRRAQAVIFPLDLGVSMAQTGHAIGRSTGWACHLRRAFIARHALPAHDRVFPAQAGSGQGRAYLRHQHEQAFLLPFVKKARRAGILIVSEIRHALNEQLGRTTAIGTTDNLLHRHGWRKVAPDTRQPNADVHAQEDWEKNFLLSCETSNTLGKGQAGARSD